MSVLLEYGVVMLMIDECEVCKGEGFTDPEGCDHTKLERALARIEALEAALRPTQDYLAFLRRSVNVGPLTNNPTKEAALLKRMMEATDAALAEGQDK